MEKKSDNVFFSKEYERLLIDILKGIAIFLMIFGHLIQHICVGFDGFGLPAHRVIYSFHMPLFMLISGYLFYKSSEKYSFSELIKGKVRSWIFPMVSNSILCFLFVTCLMDIVFQHDFHTLFSGQWTETLGSLWFLCSLFAAMVPVAVAGKVAKNKVLKIVVLLIGFLFVAFFPNKDRNVFMYPYFLIGYFYSMYKEKMTKTIKIIFCIFSLVAYAVMIPFYEVNHYIYIWGIYNPEASLADNIAVDVFRYAIGLFGSVSVISIVILILSISLKSTHPKAKHFKWLSELGKHSLQIYILSNLFDPWIQQLMFAVIPQDNIFVNNTTAYCLLFVPVVAVVNTAMLYGVSVFLEKRKIGKLIFFR